MMTNITVDSAMIGGLVSENFYHGYSYVATGFACFSNAVLIYVLLVTHVNHVGPYRWMLLSFSVVEIAISLVHFALIPAIHLTEFGYIGWGYRVFGLTTEQGVWAGLIWVLLFYQTFVLTTFHYVYRFVLMCNPPWLSWIQKNPWRNWIIIAIVADLFYVGVIFLAGIEGFYPWELYRHEFAPVMKEVYDLDLYAPNTPGFLGIVYWTLDENGERVWVRMALITILTVIIVFSSSGAVIIYCLVRIIREMSPQNAHFKSATRHMQKQLFRALLWQTIIPTFTSYMPIAFIFLGPLLTGISFGGLGTIALMSTQIFPMIDPYLVLFFVQGYRKALPKFMQKAIHQTFENKSKSATSVVMVLT